MSQRLTSLRFPVVPFRREVRQQTYEEEALLDTGFDGGMAVPPFLLQGQEPDWYQLWTLADGTQVPVPVYQGVVRLGDLSLSPSMSSPLAMNILLALGS